MMRNSVELRAEGMSSEELYTTWEQYARLCDQAKRSVDALFETWMDTADTTAKSQLEREFRAMFEQYGVLMAWTAVFQAAYVFSRYGCESTFLPDECETQVSGPVM
jgi:hypothetical protein